MDWRNVILFPYSCIKPNSIQTMIAKKALIVFCTLLWNIAGGQATGSGNSLLIFPNSGKNTISRHIYGHFSEHLGRCIYGGIWVGEDSPIPNTNGVRNDVAEALALKNIADIFREIIGAEAVIGAVVLDQFDNFIINDLCSFDIIIRRR